MTDQNENECTGLTARWCPLHGSCACAYGGENDLDDPDCPLHGTESEHAIEIRQDRCALSEDEVLIWVEFAAASLAGRRSTDSFSSPGEFAVGAAQDADALMRRLRERMGPKE